MKKIIYLVPVLAILAGALPAMADAAAGEALFNGAGKCKNCHKTTDKKKVGPGLAGAVSRGGEEWIKAFLKDPQAVWTADEGYTKTLKAAVNNTKPKPKHKTRQLTDDEIQALLDYLKTL